MPPGLRVYSWGGERREGKEGGVGGSNLKKHAPGEKGWKLYICIFFLLVMYFFPASIRLPGSVFPSLRGPAGGSRVLWLIW